ncbi:MAG: protein translocase subunit SecF [Gammaproteobacteria bacterium]|nr:protein translocase subunit SecF [Gammaproteobacteria bacterium]MCH9744163.1 protein translocase subunit SecF [Gammaproteobacteria bacterium]
MEFFKTNTKIPFMRQQKLAAIFSCIIFIGSIIAISINGLNLGLDFTGGNQAVVSFSQQVNVSQIRHNLEAAGFDQATVTPYNAHELSVRIGLYKTMSQKAITSKLLQSMPGGVMKSFDYIGPEVGKQLLTNGILAIIVSLIATMIYIAIRFEMRFAVSAAVALIHDPVLIFGIFAAFHLEFNMVVLVAVLTVIGYSLNDTIVVYDRVRENFRKIRKTAPRDIMDASINQTLSRTIMTSGLTLLVVVALYIFGGPTFYGFSLALIIGIVIGTYSSIYVAGSMAIALGLSPKHLVTLSKQADDGLP